MSLAARVSRETMSEWLRDDRGSLKHLRGSGTWMVTGNVRGTRPRDGGGVVVKIFPEGTVIDETSVYDHKIHPMREGKHLFVQPLAIVDTSLSDEDKLERVLKEHMKTDKVRLLVMERIDGDTLENFLKDETVASEEKVVALIQLLDALCIMRKNKITHNDLHFKNVMVRNASKDARNLGDSVYSVLGIRLRTDKEVKVFDWDKSIVDGLVGDTRDYNPSYDLVSVMVRLNEASLIDPLLLETREVLREAFEPLFSRYTMTFKEFAGTEHLVCERRAPHFAEATSSGCCESVDEDVEKFLEETPEWCVDNRGWPPTVHTLIPRIKKLQLLILQRVLKIEVPLIEYLEALYI